MTYELTELSELHVDYEDNPERETADELSMAVGRFLSARDYAGRTGSLPVHELSLRDRLALVLSDYDENGLQPTTAALDVIMAVIEETDRTDAEWQESAAPHQCRYAIDAERILRIRRKGWASA